LFPGNLIATIRTNLSAEPMIKLVNEPVPNIDKISTTGQEPPYKYSVSISPNIRYTGHIDLQNPVAVKAVINMKGSELLATITDVKGVTNKDNIFTISSEEDIYYFTFSASISSEKPPIGNADSGLQLNDWKKYSSYHFVSPQRGDFLITVENLETSIWDRTSHPLSPPCYVTFSIECKDSLKFVTLNDCKYCNEGMTDCNDCDKTVNLCGGSVNLKLDGNVADCDKEIIKSGGLTIDVIGGSEFVFGEKAGITFWLVDDCTDKLTTNSELLLKCSKEMLEHYEFIQPLK
jgi:hypothetical protein